jgi:UDP-glucose 4-epimerase
MKRICVIGGGGFIGKYVLRRLSETGRQITVVGRNLVSPFDQSVHYFAYTGSNWEMFEEVLSQQDEVIELSYSSTPKTSFDDPLKDIYENLAFSVKLYDVLIRCGIKKVLFVSSGGTIYGHARYTPIDEEHMTNPVSPYGITKLAIEKYGLMYHSTSALPIVIVRPGNAYGPGQKPDSGQGFISTAIGSILTGKDVIVYGKTGTVRDYIFVDDVAAGIIGALEHGVLGECYNIGSRVGVSNIEVLEMLRSQMSGSRFRINIDERPVRTYDVKKNILDSDKLDRLCGWKPVVGIGEGLERTTVWMKKYLQIID